MLTRQRLKHLIQLFNSSGHCCNNFNSSYLLSNSYISFQRQHIHQHSSNPPMISNLKDPSAILFTDPMSGIPLVFNPCSNNESTNDIIKHNLKFFSDMQVDGLFQEMCQEWLEETEGLDKNYEKLKNFLSSIGIEQQVIERNIQELQKRQDRQQEYHLKENGSNHHSFNDLFTQYKAFPYIQIEWNE
ncbi:hypothetical protein C9374_008995 [Naegleria lovaniensis]|uniref:Uncharacterized protein n=1 Tax=Naegleria lovaniensis TaxID=51637 RepID=A0AA88GIW6_NAELO|nr:uncharacterized protein C9374_008995 [Naegleria lovaniensis]KAG2377910.1 hypothetical protein C9374_008995 [Naegleria lovaniensis]